MYTTASDGSLAGSPALRPRTPVVYQTEAERRKEIVLAPVIPPTVTSITTLQQFSGSSFNNSSADLETCDMTTGPQLRAVRRPRPKSGELPPSLTQSMYPIVQRPATVGGSQSSLNGSRPATVGSQPSSDHFRKVNTTTITGAQEYAVQVMTDFFGRRPIEHMRNAFRNADVDDSGELDQLEFRQAIKAMKCGLGDKDADALFKLADQDGSGSIGIHEFFVNFRHDHWPRERFFWTKPEPNVNLAGNLTKKERVDLSDALAVQFDQPAQLSTPDIMKVLAEKVAVHGSAEKVFRVIDTNVNGKVDLDEIPEALRPFELHVSQQQAKEVLKEINRIVGKPADYLQFVRGRFQPHGGTAAHGLCRVPRAANQRPRAPARADRRARVRVARADAFARVVTCIEELQRRLRRIWGAQHGRTHALASLHRAHATALARGNHPDIKRDREGS